MSSIHTIEMEWRSYKDWDNKWMGTGVEIKKGLDKDSYGIKMITDKMK